tara:strand:- start:698 stop:3067 length:2370 start_codon:yes stop_codon:yes gene_type:complete
MSSAAISRRKFLVRGGVGSAGLAIFGSATGKPVTNLLDENSPLIIPENYEPCVWFTMQSNGLTNIHVYNTEFGQHIGTALAQIVAEELDLNWADVSIDYPSMDVAMKDRTGVVWTGGSMGVLDSFEPLRRSAAIAREFLIEAGADSMGAEISDCIAADGFVIDSVFDQKISFAQILSEHQIEHEIQPEELLEAKLKPASEFKIIGQSKRALDVPEKVNGTARYGIDAYAPNMVYGKASLAPTRLGSKIIEIDDSLAKEVPGYVTTLEMSTLGLPGMGNTEVALVIAKSFPAALRAEKALRVTWESPDENLLDEEDLWREASRLADSREGAQTWYSVGDVEKSDVRVDSTVAAGYQTSMIEHAALEPRSALVQPIDGTYHIYSGHQGGGDLIAFVASELNVAEDKVAYHPHQIGGSFGDKIYADQIVLAAKASQKLNLPVKVILTREDQFNLGHPKTISLHRLNAQVTTKDGVLPAERIISLNHDLIAAPILWSSKGQAFSDRDDREPSESSGAANFASVAGSDHWYDVNAMRVSFIPHQMMQKVIPTGSVRSVGNYYSIFAIESFIDEIAAKLKIDPLTLRLSLLRGRGRNAGTDLPGDASINSVGGAAYVSAGGNIRLANVLKIAAGIANYRSPLIGRDVGQGIAIAAAEGRHNPSFSACVADVTVSDSGFVTVDKLTVCADVGLVVNPDGARAQIEGSLLWGLSSTLYEAATLRQGRLAESNFDKYKWQKNADLPELDVHIVSNGLVPSGIGENTMSLVAPAICNAIAELTGKRLRSLPLAPQLPLV